MQSVPVEFLSDQEAAAFGRYGGSVPLADLERFFYLDDADRKLVAGQREDHNRLGFSVQLATVRYIGRFLADPLDGVPAEVIDLCYRPHYLRIGRQHSMRMNRLASLTIVGVR